MIQNIPPATPPTPSIKHKTLVIEVPAAVHKQIAQMGLDFDCSMKVVVAEALNDFFEKHRYPTHDFWG